MNTLKKYIRNAINKTKITTKMLIGYTFVVFIPVLLFGLYFYSQLYNDMIDSYSSDKQNLINQAANNMEINLTQVNSIYTLFQSNQSVISYLSGRYKTEGNQVYMYLKDIRPLFSFAYLTNESIESIKIYKKSGEILSVNGEIEEGEKLQTSFDLDILRDLRADQGYWEINYPDEEGTVPSINYYQKLYNSKYMKELGLLKVFFNNDQLNSFLTAVLTNNEMNVVMTHQNKMIYKDDALKLNNYQLGKDFNKKGDVSKGYWISSDNELLINHLYFDDLDLNFYFLSPLKQIFKDFRQKTVVFGFFSLSLLFVLSVIYYLTASVLTKRVLGLANHMRKVDENKLSIYKGKTSNDEIGFLIDSYNSLINRIDELMTEVHRAKIRQKEADYQVLQAQVNPHFLYNTLESIRMLAEIGDDPGIIESIFRLGKLLRYSIAPGENIATIEDELENIKDYLSIHKLRMADRLSYSINVHSDIRNIECPRFILQPIVENCIKHGISNMRRPGKITINVTDSNSYIKITIADNGQGIEQDKLKIIKDILSHKRDKRELETRSSGLGLYNVSERIRSYFGGKSTLQIESQLNDGTSCILFIKKN